MTRSTSAPVAYSAATRRAIAAITKHITWAEIHLDSKTGRLRALELEHIVSSLEALKELAEAHRNWADVETLSARSARHARELDNIRLGIRSDADQLANDALRDVDLSVPAR